MKEKYKSNNSFFWEKTNNSFNETINFLIKNQSGNIFAGTKNGVYFSGNNGASWEHKGLPETYIRCLAINSEGHLFAGSHGFGIFCSTDSGATWAEINSGLSETDINGIVINKVNEMFLGTESGVFKSSQNGELWEEYNNGLIYPFVDTLAISPAGNLFAGTDDGVFISLDNIKWEQSNLRNTFVSCLEINSGNDIYVGTREGLFCSTDNGKYWKNIGLQDKEILSLFILRDSTILAGTSKGFLYSVVGEEKWIEANGGFTGEDILAIISSNNEILVGTSKGAFKTSKENFIMKI
jgi:ligand-binding sensor domain-containing protein